MGVSEKRRATYDDLLKLSENVVGEIIDGVLYTSPRPASPHARAAAAISSGLFDPFDRAPGDRGGLGGWWILGEPELHLHGDVLVPDIAAWRRERMPKMPSVPAFELPPDWICEIVSPSTGRLDRRHKLPVYARERVEHLWLVDPLEKTLEVFRLHGGQWLLTAVHADTERVRIPPFDAIELDLTRWWLES